jgi:hypothetical protein
MTSSDLALDTVTLERDGHVLVMGLNRPEKRNAFNLAMLADLSRAYALLENDDTLRVGVLVAHGEHFTAGLDLVDVGPAIAQGRDPFPAGGRDPWRLDGDWTKPVVAAAQGRCLTLGIELLLAADVRIAASDTRFAQIEILRASSRSEAPRSGCRGRPAGQRDAVAAHRRRVRRRRSAPDRAGPGGGRRRGCGRARAISSRTIADRAAPLGVQATLASAHLARTHGDEAAIERLRPRSSASSPPPTRGGRAVVHRTQARPIRWVLIGARS